MTTFFVLWLLYTAPWAFGPAPMTPGWAGVALLDEEACLAALERVRQPALCLPPGAPEPEPLAKFRMD
ncbi:MAG TPA: hypothetical protein DCQ64_21575 [Candidatus Rokubacteria bacterium]|nr:hypothetical protein [Candidatus Rokubacteria bacterium]